MVSRNSEKQFGQDLVEPLLRRLLWTITIAASLIAVTAAAFGISRIVASSLINAAAAGAMLFLVRRGEYRIASIIESIVLTASTLYALTWGYGLFDIGILILPPLFLLTSVLLSRRWLLFQVVVTTAMVVSIGLAEKWRWLVRPNSALVQYDDIIDAVILLTTTAAFVEYLVSTLRRAIVHSRVAQTKTRDVLDAASDAIIIHDAKNGRVVEVTATTLRLFGCERNDLLSQHPGDHAEKLTNYVDLARTYIQRAVTEGPQSFEWVQGDNGNESWIEVMLRAANIGDTSCVVAVLRDITSRRQLERRVREAEKFRAMGQLAGGVAHDFNNQLVGILGNAEFALEAAGDNAELRSCAESVLASGRRAASLTRQLLAFARRTRLSNLPVDLHQLVAEVIELARRSIDKRIHFEQDLRAQHATTIGDASALQNALLNLLLNARDAMPAGGTIRFTTSNVDISSTVDNGSGAGLPPGAYVSIEVTDSGTGIDAELRSKIFEPFFTTKQSGTGMGLAAVQGTVLEHQGVVDVTSEVGQGSTFRILLPVSGNATPPVSAATNEPASSGNGGRVLVVDDEAAVASVVKLALEHRGYSVNCCDEGQQALELYRLERFDLVILDIMMPALDGVAVLGQIKAGNPDARVLIMSGHAPESVRARLREYPDVAILSKPFLQKELLQAVSVTMGAPRSV